MRETKKAQRWSDCTVVAADVAVALVLVEVIVVCGKTWAEHNNDVAKDVGNEQLMDLSNSAVVEHAMPWRYDDDGEPLPRAIISLTITACWFRFGVIQALRNERVMMGGAVVMTTSWYNTRNVNETDLYL